MTESSGWIAFGPEALDKMPRPNEPGRSSCGGSAVHGTTAGRRRRPRSRPSHRSPEERC